MRKHPIVEIEDVVEPFFRKNSISVADYAPDVAEQWCYARNCGFGPEHFSRGSGVKAWWTCPDCARDYKAQINNRVLSQSNCPYCNSKLVCDENSLAIRYPKLAKEWHPKKNGKRKAGDVMYGSNTHAWWHCSKCAHSWKAEVATRTTQDAGCPNCYELRMQQARETPKVRKRPRVVLDGTADDISRKWYEKWDFVPLSKSDPKIARQWHPTKNKEWKPSHFSRGSEVRAWWKCSKGPDHEWEAPIYSRCSGRGCPFCAGKRASVTNSLQSLYSEIAGQWHPKKNGELTPSDVTAHSGKIVWWLCACGAAWKKSIAQRSTSPNLRCPKC